MTFILGMLVGAVLINLFAKMMLNEVSTARISDEDIENEKGNMMLEKEITGKILSVGSGESGRFWRDYKSGMSREELKKKYNKYPRFSYSSYDNQGGV